MKYSKTFIPIHTYSDASNRLKCRRMHVWVLPATAISNKYAVVSNCFLNDIKQLSSVQKKLCHNVWISSIDFSLDLPMFVSGMAHKSTGQSRLYNSEYFLSWLDVCCLPGRGQTQGIVKTNRRNCLKIGTCCWDQLKLLTCLWDWLLLK